MELHTLENVREHVIGNGLKVICYRKPTAPVVAVQVWYKTGSASEKSGQKGISHILEHMMFRGSPHVGPEQHAQRINDVGGHCNAFTSEDVCAYINCVPSGAFDLALELEADRMNDLILSAETLETERKVIIEEYHTYMNNPVAKAFLEFRTMFFGDHPYAVSPLGTLSDIEAISARDCREYFESHYVPSNAIITVVGDFPSEQIVFEKIEKLFGGIQKPAKSDIQSGQMTGTLVRAPGNGWMERVVEFDVPMLILGYPAPASASKDALPLDILQMIVSQGESSRLHREVVRRRSCAVMAGGMNHFLRLSGMSLFFAAFTPDHSVRTVKKALDDVLRTVKDSGVSQEEMEKIRNTTLATRAFEMYSAEHICQRLGYCETVEGDYRLWIERMKALEKLDRERLIECASSWWDNSRQHALSLKPKKTRPMLYVFGLTRRLFSRAKGKGKA